MTTKIVTTCDHCKKDKPEPKKHARGVEVTEDGWVAITYNGNSKYVDRHACSQACAQVVLAQLGAEPGALRAATLANAPDLAGEMIRLKSEKEFLEKRVAEGSEPLTPNVVRAIAGAFYEELFDFLRRRTFAAPEGQRASYSKVESVVRRFFPLW